MANSQLYFHILFGCLLTVIATLITWSMRKFVRILDHPNHRSSHARAVPKSGGISIVITFLIGMAYIVLFSDTALINERYMLGFVFTSVLIAAISLIDDMQEKSAVFKLLTHVFAVSIVLYSGIVIDSLSLPWATNYELGWIGYLISFFWILGLTNAYNFMDGIDGLVGSTALIAALFFMAISYYEGSSFVYITCYTIIAGSVGFLIYNAPPAKIFMGDVGSAFLGFVFATLAIIAARFDESHTSFLVMPMLLFHFIFDTVFTLIRRLFRGESALEGHRSHLYQLLVRSGYTHLEVTLLLSCMAFLQGLGAIWMINIPGNERLFVFIPFLLIQIVYAYLTLKRARKKGVLTE
ncbi:MAG: MraY family glycosyltransferase [Pseudomonadota bacterium]